jgi:saccharopine dehydrogenase (NADP+, L-glutamate forming)
VIADGNLALAQSKSAGSLNATAVQVDVKDDEKRDAFIEQADIVISMLPPSLHSIVAKNCVSAGRHCLPHRMLMRRSESWNRRSKRRAYYFFVRWGLTRALIT